MQLLAIVYGAACLLSIRIIARLLILNDETRNLRAASDTS